MYLRFTLIAVLVLVAGCSSFSKKKELTYRGERFTPDAPFSIAMDLTPEKACDAGRRALLSQGYGIDEIKPDAIKARKFFQPEPGVSVQISFSLSCLAEGEGATVFANARELRDELKASSNSAGVSVAGLGSLSLPLGGTGESLVKVGEETITDADFYGRFFALMQTFNR